VTKTFNLAWLTSGVTAKRVDELAKSLDVGLHSPGVCSMCLLLVATELEREDGRPAAGRITMIAPTLWAEGSTGPCETRWSGRCGPASRTRLKRYSTSMSEASGAGSSARSSAASPPNRRRTRDARTSHR
jgi:hypothetical protein